MESKFQQAMIEEPAGEGQQSKSETSIVSEVLSNFSPSSKFLHKVGLTPSKQRSNSLHDAHVQELEDQLQLEREQSADLVHQMEELRKKQEETEGILRRLLSARPGEVTS